MSPGPQNDLPVCPEATWITRLGSSFMVDSFSSNRRAQTCVDVT